MPRYAPNKMPAEVKRRYFELIRTGLSGSAAAQEVGVSLSCGSLWFIDAGRVSFVETPISPRYLSQDDRIEIADGRARGEPVKQIAARIGKSYQTVYRELARNRKSRRALPALVRAQPGASAAPPAQATPVRGRCRAARGGGRQARQALVSGADQPLAAATLSPPQRLACVHRDHL